MTGEPYQVEVTATARRCLRRLPEKVVGACVEFIAGPLAANPHQLGKPLERELAGHFSARRGTYRVVYLVDENARTVTVVRVDHRGDVYRS
ncbi:MAG: type II toxin-antitoxin system RelE family toxin, partial [Pseudonocardiaceae bacterium]